MLACQEAGFVPLVSQQAVQIQTVLSLVESGLGIALVPSIMQRYVSDKILYRPLQKIHMGAVGFALAWMEETESPAGAKFREMAVSIC
jgi:DNA-binding transcriptional LysR family regulator